MTALGDQIIAPWLASIRADLGQEEIPGPAVNPRIIAKAHLPGVKFPEVPGLVAYGDEYKDDDGQAWCGAESGGSVAEVGLMPPFNPADNLKSYLWAASWQPWGVPCDMRRGAIACFPRHVAMVDEVIDADHFWCIGGNQSSPKGGAVTRTRRARSEAVAFRWPSDDALAKANLSQWSLNAKPGDAATTTVRPLISRKLASTGGFVTEAQKLLSVTPSGIFDDALDAAVRAFQRQRGLDVDGEIGTDTWRALLGTNVTIAGDVPHAAEYLADWAAMAIEPAHADEIERYAHQAFQNKARYQAAVAGTSVPWWFVAGCHLRESTFDFTKNIHNGQPLGQVTTIEPLHRGPFPTFEASVRDWIALKALDKVTTWSLAQAAYRWELNNGPGYRNHGVPSAYLWSFSNIYIGGKFPRDHVWDPNMKDKQCGTMPLLHRLAELDSTITFDDDPNRKPPMTDISQPTPNPPPANSVLIPPSQSILHQIIAAAVQAELDDLKRHPEKVTALLGKIASGAKLLGGATAAPQPDPQPQPAAPPSPPPIAPTAPPTAPVTGLAAVLSALGGGSNVTFWASLATAVGHVILNQAGVVGAPTAVSTTGGTIVGNLLASGSLAGTMAGIYGKLSTIAAKIPALASIVALIPK